MLTMKKIVNQLIITFALLAISSVSFGQRAFTAPAAFMVTESVKITVSTFGTVLEDNPGPMTMWLAANDDEIISTGVQCEGGNNFWSFTIATNPNDYFATTVTVIKGVLKTSDGSVASNQFQVTPYDFSTVAGMLTIAPSRPYYSENVSVIFDRTKSDRDNLSEVAPIYMWAWNNTESLGDAANQGSWGSIAESTALTQVPGFPNLWRKDFVPQVYWNTNKAMTTFGCLFRSKAGDKQTNDALVTLYKAPGLVEKPKKVKTFPMSFTKLDVVTIIYDQKLEENPALKASDAIYITTTIFSETYRPQPNPISTWTQNWTAIETTPAIQRLKMIPYGNPQDSVFRITYVPQTFYGYYSAVSPTLNVAKMFVTFRNLSGTGISEKEELKVEKPD